MRSIVKIFFIVLLVAVSEIPLIAQQREIVGYFPGGVTRNNHYNVKNIITSGSADILTVIDYAFSVPAPDSLGRIIPVLSQPEFAYQKIFEAEFSVDSCGRFVAGSARKFQPIKKTQITLS